MIPISEFQQRALGGPVMKEREFDKTLSRRIREIVSRYDISYDPETIIADDALADAVFQAGVDLLAEVGLYHRDTQRVIQLSKEEVLQIAKAAWEGPRRETFGKGQDEVTIHHRTFEDPRPPAVFLGTMSTSTTEEVYIPWLQSFAQEELSQGMTSFGTLPGAGGVQNKPGTPGEVACTMAEVRSAQEAARRAGRPGMLFGIGSGTSPGALMAQFFPGALERHNGLVPLLMNGEQKLDWNLLVLALCAEQRGLLLFTNPVALIGAICRGAEDAAVMLVAGLLGQLAYGHGTFASSTLETRDATKDRTALWAHSAAFRASERHIGIPIGAAVSSAAGAGTEMALYEKAAVTSSYVASGVAFIRAPGCRKRKAANCNTGLEGRIVAETARALAGMPRERVNDLLKQVFGLFEDHLGSAPEGKTFPELYDIETVQPKAEYLAVYQRAKEHLAGLGIPYK